MFQPNRRCFSGFTFIERFLLLVLMTVPFHTTPAVAQQKPNPRNQNEIASSIDIGSVKQLFVGPWTEDGRDEYLVDTMRNVTMTMNEARVTGERLLVNDRPWEGTARVDNRQFVLKDGDIFRMYYSALVRDPQSSQVPFSRVLCYAESSDGIHWDKPNLGLWEWEGSRDNNIILPNDDFEYVFPAATCPAVFIDPVAKSPDEKYKMFLHIYPWKGGDYGDLKPLRKAQYPFCSPDGIRWKLMNPRRVNGRAADTQFSVFWDQRVGQYVSYTRVKPPRMVGRAVSDDFLHWRGETTVMAADEADLASLPPLSDKLDLRFGGLDFYGGNVTKYSEADNVYISLLQVHSHWKVGVDHTYQIASQEAPGQEQAVSENMAASRKPQQLPATLDVQLATSRDGVHWNRAPGRKPFIRLGPQGSFWSKQIWSEGNAIRVGDELWMYFTGLDVPHNSLQSVLPSNGAKSRAVLRLDGFISADVDYHGGEMTTRPLIFSGSKLQLNLATGAGGFVKVEIQDEDGKPITGFALSDEADEISGNYIRVFATWNGETDVSSLAGQPIRLRFVMRDSKLYSFQFLP